MWKLDSDAATPLWRPHADPHTHRLAFTTRVGGVSAVPYDSLNLGRSTADRPAAVDTNRTRVLAAFRMTLDQLATAGQVHSSTVTVVNDPGLHPTCDALVCSRPGIALAVSGADCLPMLFTAPGAVAAAHAGWRGVAAGIPIRTLEVLCSTASVDPDSVRVHLGPANRPCCYEVGPEVASQFPSACVAKRDGRLYLDVPGAARAALLDAGIAPDAISDLGECTSCRADRYFSHRRDRGITGRQWGIVALGASA